jgi:hypothetical protein
MSFAHSFLPLVLPPARDRLAAAAPALDALLAARWQAARRAWPTVALAAADFCAYAGARVPITVESVDAIAALRLDELYLACACVTGDPAALAAVEAHYLPVVGAAHGRMQLDHAADDEVKQRLRRRRTIARELRFGLGSALQPQTRANRRRRCCAELGLDVLGPAVRSGAVDFIVRRLVRRLLEHLDVAVHDLLQG